MNYITDKQVNGLTDDYERKFEKIRGQKISLLEIGILNGGSLLYWSGFFSNPETKIVGIDRNIPEISLPQNVSMIRCDQNDSEKLKAIVAHMEKIDIVIDDGAHSIKETANCFSLIWPHVKVGGYYVIEDWAVGYWDKPEKAMVEFISEMVINTPELKISSFDIVLDKNKAIAFFQKGEKGWEN
jgi:cephalosporin hydroxylase